MTPIYASNRIDLSGWYAYDQPEGDLVLWDGGLSRAKEYSRGGLWDYVKGHPVYRDPAWLDQLPNLPMFGHLDGDHFNVIDFPHVGLILPYLPSRPNGPQWSLESEDGGPLPFFVSVLNGPQMLETCDVASFVRCSILPEDKETSLRLARERGDQTMVRHPMSSWSLKRNPLFASVKSPPRQRCRIREVTIDDDGYVSQVSVWTNLAVFSPMYWGDHLPENKVFVPTEPLNVYIGEGIVLGYD